MSTITITTADAVHVYDTAYFTALLHGEPVDPLPQPVLRAIVRSWLEHLVIEDVALAQLVNEHGVPVTVPQAALVTQPGTEYDFVAGGQVVRVQIRDEQVVIEV